VWQSGRKARRPRTAWLCGNSILNEAPCPSMFTRQAASPAPRKRPNPSLNRFDCAVPPSSFAWRKSGQTCAEQN
jgi:hypothetical protein